MLAPSALRQLLSPDGSLEEKLQLALSLAMYLLPNTDLHQLFKIWNACKDSQGRHAQMFTENTTHQSLPQVVHVHYVQTVCDWATATIIKSATAASQSGGINKEQANHKRKHTQQLAKLNPQETNPDNNNPQPSNPAYSDPRLWWLASMLVSAGATHVQHTIIQAAVKACRHASEMASTNTDSLQSISLLLSGISQLLACVGGSGQQQGLVGKQNPDWQPQLESLTNLLSTLLSLRKAVMQPVIESSTQHAVEHSNVHTGTASSMECAAALASLMSVTLQELLRSIQNSQNPRKALTAILEPQALHSLLCLAFPEPISTTALSSLNKHSSHRKQTARSIHSVKTLSNLATKLLEAALLHESHVPGFLEACKLMSQSLLGPKSSATEAAKQDNEGEKQEAKADDKRDSKDSTVQPQPFSTDALLDAVHSYHRSIFQALLSAAISTNVEVRHAALHSLPWLLSVSCKVIAHQRRSIHAELSLALRAATHKSSKKSKIPELSEGNIQPLHQAEFQVYASLSGLIASQLLVAGDGGQSSSSSKAVSDHKSEDAAPKRKKQRTAEQHQKQEQSTAGALPEVQADIIHGLTCLFATARATRAYEPTQDATQSHRTYLTHLMQHIMGKRMETDSTSGSFTRETATAICGAVCAMLQLEYRALTCDLPSLWSLLVQTAHADVSQAMHVCDSTGSTPSSNKHSVAASCLQHLVKAYAELRQLSTLLESLLDTMIANKDNTHQNNDVCFSWLVSHPDVISSLWKAVHGLAPGQCAPLLTALVSKAQTLFEAHVWGHGHDDHKHAPHTALAVGCLLTTCISALKLELPSSAGLAAAAVKAISLLANPLVTFLAPACAKQLDITQTTQLTLLLRTYLALLRLHGQCASLNPEIPALPSQARRLASHESDMQAQPSGISQASLGFFAAAAQHADPAAISALHTGLQNTLGNNELQQADTVLLVVAKQQQLSAPSANLNGNNRNTLRDSLQLGLSGTLIDCTMHQAAGLQEQLLCGQHVCIPGKQDEQQAAEHQQQLASIELSLKQLLEMIAPCNLEQGQSHLATLLAGWNKQHASANTGIPSSQLNCWLTLPVGHQQSNYANMVAWQCLQQPAQTNQHQTQQQQQHAVMSQVHSDVTLLAFHVRQVWATSLQAISSFGQYIQPDHIQQQLQLLFASQAMAGSASTVTLDNRPLDGTRQCQVEGDMHAPRCMYHVVAEAADTLLCLQDWQSLPHIQPHVAPALLQVCVIHSQQVVAAWRQLVSNSTHNKRDKKKKRQKENDTNGTLQGSSKQELLDKICTALGSCAANNDEQTHALASKVLKAQSKQWSTANASATQPVPNNSQQTEHASADNTAFSTAVSGLTSLLHFCRRSIHFKHLPTNNVQQVSGCLCLTYALLLQLLDCSDEPGTDTGLSHVLSKQQMIRCCQEVAATMRVVQQSIAINSCGLSSNAQLDCLQQISKHHLAWLEAAGTVLANQLDKINQTQSLSEGSTAQEVDLTLTMHASLIEGAVASQLRSGRLEGDEKTEEQPEAEAFNQAMTRAQELLSKANGTKLNTLYASASLSACSQHLNQLAAGQLSGSDGQQAIGKKKQKRAGAQAAAELAIGASKSLLHIESLIRSRLSDHAHGPGNQLHNSSCLLSYAALLSIAATSMGHKDHTGVTWPQDSSRWLLQFVTSTQLTTQQIQAAAISAVCNLAELSISTQTETVAGSHEEDVEMEVAALAVHDANPAVAMGLDLLEAHVHLLSTCSPPEQCRNPPWQQHTLQAWWGFDVLQGSWPAHARAMLLGSLRHILQSSGSARYAATLHHLMKQTHLQVTQLQTKAATVPPRLPVLLHCMLVALETEGGPSTRKAATSQTSSLMQLLHQLVTALTSWHPLPVLDIVNQPAQVASSTGNTSSNASTAMCLAFRCLESITGRPVSFQISDGQLANCLGCITATFQSPCLRMHKGLLSQAVTGYGVVSSACALLISCLRHRPQPTRSCIALVVEAIRALTAALLSWAAATHNTKAPVFEADAHSTSTLTIPDTSAGQDDVEAITISAAAIARVYEAIVQDKEHVAAMRPYCMQLLGDYITQVAMALPHSKGDEQPLDVLQPGQGGLLPPGAAKTLKQGALTLLGPLGPRELQALHVALGPGWGGTRRGVLAALRKEWERSLKYSGKV